MCRNGLIILLGLVGLALWPAHAQVQADMNHIRCRDFLSYDFENKNFVGYWMSGYYSASRNNDELDLKRLQRNAEKSLLIAKSIELTPYLR